MAMFESGDPAALSKMRGMFGPGHLDQQVRQLIQFGWMMLPEDRKTIDELQKQIQRLVDRAFQDLREDHDAFGLK